MSYSKHAESKLLLKVIEKQQNTITSLSKNAEEMQRTIKDLQAVQSAETLDSGKNKERKNTPRKPKATRDELQEALPIKPIHCDVPEAARFCPDCNAPMNHLGYTFVREELRVIPAKVYRVQYFQEKLVCPTCHEEDDTTIIAANVYSDNYEPCARSFRTTITEKENYLHGKCTVA